MENTSHYTSSDLGGLKRGDGAETGDLEARPTETPDPIDSGFSENDLAGLTVKDVSDSSLGLTNIGDIPPEDWAADTGPDHSAESDAPSHKP